MRNLHGKFEWLDMTSSSPFRPLTRRVGAGSSVYIARSGVRRRSVGGIAVDQIAGPTRNPPSGEHPQGRWRDFLS
jgi:hypothetical protein